MSVALSQPTRDTSGPRRVVAAVALSVALAAGAAVLFVTGSATEEAKETEEPRLAPAFTVPELRADRPPVTLPESSDRPVVLNFFAAWCGPCKEELPALREAATSNPGVVFIGIDHQDSRDDAIEMVDAFGIPYPAGYDPRGDVAARYGVRGLPATVFIDGDGRIVELHQGALTPRQLDEKLRRLTLQGSEA